ncbi:MAG: peptidoglycan-binding protein [Candidatus Eisenbacteria bacterium]|uniref:Peptidoglycan-binding protein n=1 Tax=Eiseniibacteriota bacterium TaxID=2212470 RepID=A0A948RT95_UNCEI|nr:peptidoglycan-binding protein [Candidatus Eisenbacteria bacterium]MBU1950144.1 peptidoglycan-binding protein [Candidatus Eisenbacteria bacterium]MBU2689596.1 peptidoglycan-binding protein [Candidatus Eisenbacteria bacterium]
MTGALLLLFLAVTFPWGPLAPREVSPDHVRDLIQQEQWSEADQALATALSQNPTSRWLYLNARSLEAQGRWWEAWKVQGALISRWEEPWWRLGAARWARLDFQGMGENKTGEAPIWAVVPLKPLDGSPQTTFVARALSYVMVRYLRGSIDPVILGPRQLVNYKRALSLHRGVIPPTHTPAGAAATLSVLGSVQNPTATYLEPSQKVDEEALRQALIQFQTDMGLETTGRPDAVTAVALQKALSSWLSRETMNWTPEAITTASKRAGATRVLEGTLRALDEGGYRWSLALLDATSGEVVAGPHEGWLREGRWEQEWAAALSALGVQPDRSDPTKNWIWGASLPNEASAWEAWGQTLSIEDGQDPVQSAQVYAVLASQYGDRDWGWEFVARAEGWLLPLSQVQSREEELFSNLARYHVHLDSALRQARCALSPGLPGSTSPTLPGQIFSPSQILGDDGRFLLEGQIP